MSAISTNVSDNTKILLKIIENKDRRIFELEKIVMRVAKKNIDINLGRKKDRATIQSMRENDSTCDCVKFLICLKHLFFPSTRTPAAISEIDIDFDSQLIKEDILETLNS